MDSDGASLDHAAPPDGSNDANMKLNAASSDEFNMPDQPMLAYGGLWGRSRVSNVPRQLLPPRIFYPSTASQSVGSASEVAEDGEMLANGEARREGASIAADSQHSRSSQSSRSRGSQHSRSSQQPRGSPGAGGGPRVEKILSRVTSPVAAEERRAFLPADRRPGPEMGPYGRDRATPDPFYYGPPRWRQRAWVTEGEEDGQQDGVQLRRDKNF